MRIDSSGTRHFLSVFVVLSLAALFLSSLGAPYLDADPALYTLGGEGIVRYGLMPYQYVFDHKPALIFLFYAPLTLMRGFGAEFQIFSAVWILLISEMIFRIYDLRKISRLLVVLFVSTGAFETIQFSGNSEYVSVFFLLLSIGLILRDPRHPRIALVASSISAVTAVFVNYSNIVIFILPIAVALPKWHSGISVTLGRFGIFFGCSIAVAIIYLGAMLISGVDLNTYFQMQHKFLSGYAELPVAPDFRFVVKAMTLSLLGIAAIAVKKFSQSDRLEITDIAAAAVMVGGLIFVAISRKPWAHFLFFMVVPCVVLICRLSLVQRRQVLIASLLSCCLILFSIHKLATMGSISVFNEVSFARPYRTLAETVGRRPVMSMRASVIPLYYSDVYPAQPIVWDNQTGMMFGAGEDRYYLGILVKRSPDFVMTAPHWCNPKTITPRSCGLMISDYRKVMAFNGDGQAQVGFDLYRRTLNQLPSTTVFRLRSGR